MSSGRECGIRAGKPQAGRRDQRNERSCHPHVHDRLLAQRLRLLVFAGALRGEAAPVRTIATKARHRNRGYPKR
jgi:hypothetical protein